MAWPSPPQNQSSSLSVTKVKAGGSISQNQDTEPAESPSQTTAVTKQQLEGVARVLHPSSRGTTASKDSFCNV